MNERYKVLKNIYPNYLIVFKKNNELLSINIDKDIIDIFSINTLKNVNKIIINNLDIDLIEEYDDNQYSLYYVKTKLIKLINELRMVGSDE